ncbi:MAG: putative hydrolase [Promethearchaeota archaeon]|nr:MAG: putative hydrolase [Candidatus Lokiarchaeota archaeon]
MKDKDWIEKGFLEDGLPYVRIGNKPKILLNIEALSFKHEPPSGFELGQFKKAAKKFTSEYTVYLVGRKPNLPENYLMDKMANDYAQMIRREFKGPVDVMGVSTGGQIAHYLAADHPDTVKKLVLISTAYRLSKEGVEIERRAAEFFKQEKYGKSLATITELIFRKKFWRKITSFFIRLFFRRMLGEIKYPNDFLVEIQADREMNFLNRLHEIKAPTLILSGEDDIGYTAEDVRITADCIPNSELILYEGYGHNLFNANRKKVLKEIWKFLQKE